MFEQLGLIGCGLMGGSFALALKRARLVRRVVGYSKSPSTTERARQLGVIDAEAPSALQAVSGSDIVLLAVPVASTEQTFKAIRHLLTDEMLVMDVGSTKRNVVEAARRVLRERIGCFVPCHPVTGKELSGVEHADPDLYHGQKLILTPIDRTLVSQLGRAQAVWEAIGARVLQMSPEAHDASLAAVSHLPHMLAFALMNGIIEQPHGQDILAMGGPGFRDFTRIAGGEPKMWRDILLANREEMQVQLDMFRRSLAAIEQAMQAGDAEALHTLISQASSMRTAWRMTGRK